jgi:hypothetical protein
MDVSQSFMHRLSFLKPTNEGKETNSLPCIQRLERLEVGMELARCRRERGGDKVVQNEFRRGWECHFVSPLASIMCVVERCRREVDTRPMECSMNTERSTEIGRVALNLFLFGCDVHE